MFEGMKPLLPPPTDAVSTTDVTVPSSGQGVRIYNPTRTTGKLPVGLYIHSGGWYAGSIENEDFLCRNVAENAEIVLYSVEYRLAPEHPFPAGLDDVCAAYEFMHETAAGNGADPTQKFIMGGSAGGNYTAAVGLKYATNADLKAKGLCIFVPATCDPSALPDEYKAKYTPERYEDAPVLGNDLVRQAREWYGAPAADPLYSVLLHPDIKHLPPCYIAACTKDPTHQDTLFFSEECKKQGVAADYVEWVGMPHFFWSLPMLKKSQEFMSTWSKKLKDMNTAA
ncbi:hypothetical protein LTR70_008224 [Exophiala xenobiotica]|nr:hypothetical protein LTR70_008224 [Exophiala xenobiotica]